MEHIKELLKIFYVPTFNIGNCIEILITIYFIYKLIATFKNTRAWIILKGILILCGFYSIAYICNFNIITMVFQSIVPVCAMALVVIFQQDLKKLLEQIGNKSIWQYILDIKNKAKKEEKPKRMSDKTIDELTTALFELSKTKTGSLIVIEKDVPLDDIIATGISVNAEISSALLINIFEKNTPLHDGAVIVKNDKILSATCYLPLSTNTQISKSLGTRHRAGIGATEAVDCLVLISSEETGSVSIVENGNIIRGVTPEKLKSKLLEIQEYPQTNISLNPKKKIFNSNFKLKVFSAIIGLLFWFIAMGTIDPIMTTTIEDIPIQIMNEHVITDINKTYDLGDIETVDIVVRDRSSVLKDLDETDFKAIADLSKLSYVNTVDISVIVNNATTEIEKITESTIKVNLDDISYGEFPIEINPKGEPIPGHSVKQIDLSNTTIIITGAETQIKKIDKVVAEINIENVQDGQEIKFIPVVYDKNGDQIDKEKLTFNTENLSAYLYLEKTKTIPLKISITDAENSAGQIKDISYEPTEITIAGTTEQLENIDLLDIKLPVKIDISNDNNTKLTKVITLTEYLPEGIVLREEEQKVTITITYEPYPSKVFTIDTIGIPTIGAKNHLKYKFATETIDVSVIAKENILNSLTAKNLSMNVNVEDIKNPGTYDVVINITSDKNIIVSNVKTQIVVTED